MKPKVGDEAKIFWCDVRHEDDLSLNEIKKLEPAPAVTYGKILVQNDSWLTLASTEFPNENGTEYRGILVIPQCLISRIKKQGGKTMIKFWLENPNEVENAVEYVWLDGIVTNIYSPYQFELKEKMDTFYCDYTKTINPVEPLELNIDERYSVQGHLTGEKVNGARELWVCGKPVPHSVIEERRKERTRVEEEVKEEIREELGVPEEYQLKMEEI